MKANRQLCIGLSIAVTWLSGNGWRRADSRVEEIYSADFISTWPGGRKTPNWIFCSAPTSCLSIRSARQSPSFSSLDPMILLTAIAGETRRIGLISTASTTFLPLTLSPDNPVP